MKLFAKKENIVLRSEEERDNLVEKLENLHIKYAVRKDSDGVSGSHITYIIRLRSEDMQKVI